MSIEDNQENPTGIDPGKEALRTRIQALETEVLSLKAQNQELRQLLEASTAERGLSKEERADNLKKFLRGIKTERLLEQSDAPLTAKELWKENSRSCIGLADIDLNLKNDEMKFFYIGGKGDLLQKVIALDQILPCLFEKSERSILDMIKKEVLKEMEFKRIIEYAIKKKISELAPGSKFRQSSTEATDEQRDYFSLMLLEVVMTVARRR